MRYLYAILLFSLFIYPKTTYSNEHDAGLIKNKISILGLELGCYAKGYGYVSIVIRVNKQGPLWWMSKDTVIRYIADGESVIPMEKNTSCGANLNKISKNQIIWIAFEKNGFLRTREIKAVTKDVYPKLPRYVYSLP